jgi:deoxycytidylate deaminase
VTTTADGRSDDKSAGLEPTAPTDLSTSERSDGIISDSARATGSPNRPELVFGLVGALGTDLHAIQQELQSALRMVGYNSSVIRLSKLMADFQASTHASTASAETKMGELMRQGDELRRAGGLDAMAALGISRLVSERTEENPDGSERQGHATILWSLKRQDEVETLREVYGQRFILIGGWATRDDRAAEVGRRLRADHHGHDVGWYAQQIALLMARDEEDETQRFGQGVRDAFELADVYVALRGGRPNGSPMTRLVRLLFGSPFETPTRHEEAMFLASGAGLRSSAAGRQVGAIVVDPDGEVLVTGTNEVPKAGGGQYWYGEIPDHRDFTYGYDINDRLKLQIVADMLTRLHDAGWLAEGREDGDSDALAMEAMSGPLRGSRVSALLEFGRIAHAEMAAICTAARRGTAIRNTVMYSNTYPCHECARLIIAAGITKVVYVDPYPKSQVQQMFREEVSEGPSEMLGTVAFEPFEGVAPRLFQQVFRMSPRRRDKTTGKYFTWNGAASSPRLLADVVAPPLTTMEESIIHKLDTQLHTDH